MNVGVLVSGEGTNLQALLDAEARGELAPATITVVVSNVTTARALDRAKAAGKPAVAIDHRGHTREAFEDLVLAALVGVDLVVLAGFMRVLTPHFLARFPARVINTHPSLLPLFPGKDATAQAIAAGAATSGVTVHFVDAIVDAGPVIAQASVAVEPRDTPATLHDRIKHQEHVLLPRIVQQIAAGAIRKPDVAQ
ncbi:MAG TPA: phosphoribosylglycinamide formyltransferase [Kofleriaceae bacterium]|jgi:phosphoribosylglycinamide formyltransferase-1|nr:phosphoribosylglycinamide formyltransferase [Kofleriaceae bacterium]